MHTQIQLFEILVLKVFYIQIQTRFGMSSSINAHLRITLGGPITLIFNRK